MCAKLDIGLPEQNVFPGKKFLNLREFKKKLDYVIESQKF